MPTRFRPGAGIDARVAERFAVPAARRITDELFDRVRANVPDAGRWITAQDDRVRPSHREADGQTIPDNLRYVLERRGGHELARAPRDPDLTPENRLLCRCISVALPGVVAEHVAKHDVVVTGSTARSSVSVTFPRIVESENPGDGDSEGGWAARAVRETLASVRARR